MKIKDIIIIVFAVLVISCCGVFLYLFSTSSKFNNIDVLVFYTNNELVIENYNGKIENAKIIINGKYKYTSNLDEGDTFILLSDFTTKSGVRFDGDTNAPVSVKITAPHLRYITTPQEVPKFNGSYMFLK